ncbi:MAG: hypothetical protein WD068_03640 [Candidatus Babeliales bacterium]
MNALIKLFITIIMPLSILRGMELRKQVLKKGFQNLLYQEALTLKECINISFLTFLENLNLEKYFRNAQCTIARKDYTSNTIRILYNYILKLLEKYDEKSIPSSNNSTQSSRSCSPSQEEIELLAEEIELLNQDNFTDIFTLLEDQLINNNDSSHQKTSVNTLGE